MGYLVISRRIGEKLFIGDDIEILISDMSDGKVDIAIKAPKSYDIVRETQAEDREHGTNTRNQSRQRHKAT